MKKNYTLFLFAILFAFTINAQTTLSHSTSQVITPGNTVACPTEPTQYLRVFDLVNEFGIGADVAFDITEVQFGVEVSETTPVTLNLYTADGTDPTTATLTNIYTAAIPVGISEEGTVVSHTLTSAVNLPAMSILVMEIAESSDGIVFRVGSNQDGQTAPSWLRSDTCGEGTVESFDFINHYVMNVIGNELLGVNDFETANISVSPNPTTDFINLEMANSISDFSTELYNITGQLVMSDSNNNKLNIANLNSGVYLLKIKSGNNFVTKRVIKQ